MKKDHKGYIFDLDGTLLDSMFIWETLGEDYIRSKGLIPEKDTTRILKKMNIFQAAEYFKSTYPLDISAEDIAKEMLHMVDDFYFNKAALKEGVADFIKSAAEKGIKMVIATVSDRYLVVRALERCGIAKYIDSIFVADELKTNKTQPDIYLKAQEFLALDIKDICVFEDTLHAAKTAKAAGFYVAGIKDAAAESDTEDIKSICDEYAESFSKLL